MDTRAIFLLGCLISNTYGFIPRFIRRDEVAQTAQRPDEISREEAERMETMMSCLLQAVSCAPIEAMMRPLFQANYGNMFIVNNKLTFSCSAETKQRFEECADTIRSSCAGHTNWINGFAGLYNDLCAMEPDLLLQAACMNSVQVGEEFTKCLRTAHDLRSFCQTLVPCIQGALDSEPRCEPQFKDRLMAAITSMHSTQYGNCEMMEVNIQ